MLHANELGLPAQQDRLDNEGGEIPDNVVKLYPDFCRVRDICNHEACEAGQHFDRLGHVQACGDREVKDNWKQAPLPQLLPQGIEDRFTLLREAAEDQHRLGGDRVDDVADLLVVEQQVYELRNLDVIDGDLGLVARGDDQVLLLRSLHFDSPRCYAVN